MLTYGDAVPAYNPVLSDNKGNNSVAMLELTYPLDLVKHLEGAREHKKGKMEYQESISRFERVESTLIL